MFPDGKEEERLGKLAKRYVVELGENPEGFMMRHFDPDLRDSSTMLGRLPFGFHNMVVDDF